MLHTYTYKILQVWWPYPQRKFELFLWTQKRWRGHGWHVSHSPRLWQLQNSDGLVLLASNASAEALHLRMPSMRRHEMWRIYPAGPSGAGTALEQPPVFQVPGESHVPCSVCSVSRSPHWREHEQPWSLMHFAASKWESFLDSMLHNVFCDGHEKLLQRCRTKGPRCLLHSKLLWDLLSLFPCWKCSCMSETKGFAFIAPYRQACRNRNLPEMRTAAVFAGFVSESLDWFLLLQYNSSFEVKQSILDATWFQDLKSVHLTH